MQCFLELHGHKIMSKPTFCHWYDCEKWINDQGFKPYILVKKHRIFRKITNQVDTCFARTRYKNGNYIAEFAHWPENRSVVIIDTDSYKQDALEIIEWLKNHDKCLVNPAGGIIDPDIFSSTTINKETKNKQTFFTFIDKTFAAEFKVIWW